MLDFHTHILPEIDDGAQSVEESVKMLKMLKEQGVSTVALTPHYIAMDESPDEFITRRDNAYKKLLSNIKKSQRKLPKLLLGAEVFYYPGICKFAGIDKLTLQSTDLLLLEMPMTRWSDYTIRELEEMANNSYIDIVIAHVERCLKHQKRGTIERLLKAGVKLQVNASFFISRSTRKKAIKMFKQNKISYIGTDCHNVDYRPPRMSEAITILREHIDSKLVDEFIKQQIY